MGESLNLSLISYDDVFVNAVAEYAADMEHIVDEKAIVNLHPEVGRAVWKAAKAINGTGASWGGLIPGVSLDCAGAVITVATNSGLYKVPKGVLAKYGGCKTRNEDMQSDSIGMHKRMLAILMYMALRFAGDGYRSVPVVNCGNVLPGDIYSPTNIAVVNGVHTYPHAVICVAPGRMLHASPQSGKVEIMDVFGARVPEAQDEGVSPEDILPHLSPSKPHSVVFRCIKREEDAIAAMHEAKLLKIVADLTRR